MEMLKSNGPEIVRKVIRLIIKHIKYSLIFPPSRITNPVTNTVIHRQEFSVSQNK